MPFGIVRNDITKMNAQAIVNTANDHPTVGTGCDHAVYEAAGYDELLAYRKEKIGFVPEGDVFITPGFALPAEYIIHAVSPYYIDGKHGEEELLRSCYRKSLALAAEHGISSIAFPLISTGGFGYPKEEGMRIAVDEIHAFLLTSDMQVTLVVFDEKAAGMGKRLYPDLEAYIDRNYVKEKQAEEYGDAFLSSIPLPNLRGDDEFSGEWDGLRERRRRRRVAGGADDAAPAASVPAAPTPGAGRKPKKGFLESVFGRKNRQKDSALWSPDDAQKAASAAPSDSFSVAFPGARPFPEEASFDEAIEELEQKLAERMQHLSDSFPEYLLYLIRSKGMENAEVYKRAVIDKKVFSKIKNNPNYHPQKLTALCLCIGAKLDLDETRDLLARAGYALSPCDKTDIIFSYFIEHGIYDMIELDIQLEEHGLPCIIS